MSDIHSNEAIERLRQKVKAADDSLHDVLRMVETVSTQQKDINSMNMKLKESVQKIFTLEAQLDKSVSARTMQSKEIQIQQDKLERSKEECQKLSDLNRVEKQKAREYEQKLRDLESSKDEIMKYMKYKDLKIQHLESDAVQHEHKIGMLENVLEIQKSKLNELRTELENSQRNKREKLKLFGRNEEEMPSLCSTTEPIHPDRKLEKESKELKSDRTAEACKQTSEQTSGNQDQANDARNNQGKTKLTEADEDTVKKSGEIVLCEPDAETHDKDRQSEGQEKESTKGQELDKKKKYNTRRIQEECRSKEDNTANGLNTIKELEDEIKETHDRASKTMKNKSERKATIDSEEMAKLKQQLKEMTTEKENIKSKMEDTKKEKDATVAKKVKEIRNLEKEKDELLCRLSEMAGRRPTDNNQNIADLSDLNRPTKLAEKYDELYDNDWTDAYSYLDTLDAYKGSDVTVIAALMTMLTTAYKISLETSESQLEALHHILSDFQGSIQHQDQQVKDVIKQLKDQRKRAVQPSKVLTEKYRKEIEKAFPKLDSSIFESDALKPYLQKCLQLCWLMAIQDPPVHLKCDGCKKGELFDKNMYKEYTQAGQLIIYTVWPALFLEKDGALLFKGVVQCGKRHSVKCQVPVSRKSSSLGATGTQPLTTFPAKDNISDKIDGGTNMETKRDHSEKRNSKTVYVKL